MRIEIREREIKKNKMNKQGYSYLCIYIYIYLFIYLFMRACIRKQMKAKLFTFSILVEIR